MILANQILSAVVVNGPPPTYTLNVYARLESLLGNDKNIYHRKNGGSWILGTTIVSTTCSNVFDITGLANGDLIEFAVEGEIDGNARIYHGKDNTPTCSGTGGADYSDERGGLCIGNNWFPVTMGSADRDCAIWITDFLCI